MEEVTPETWAASAQVPEPRNHLLSCLLRHLVFLEGLALRTYLPLPSASSTHTQTHEAKNGQRRGCRESPVCRLRPDGIFLPALWPCFPRGNLPVLNGATQSMPPAEPEVVSCSGPC